MGIINAVATINRAVLKFGSMKKSEMIQFFFRKSKSLVKPRETCSKNEVTEIMFRSGHMKKSEIRLKYVNLKSVESKF